jgi:hypothetical protein
MAVHHTESFQHVPKIQRQEGSHVISTGSSEWQRNVHRLVWFASNLDVLKQLRQWRSIVEKVQPVEIVTPESEEFPVGTTIPAEANETDTNGQQAHQRCKVFVWIACGDDLTDRGMEKLIDYIRDCFRDSLCTRDAYD